MHKNRMAQMKSWAVALTVDTPYRHNRNSPTATSLLCRTERCASSSMTEGSCCRPFCSSSAQPNIRNCVNWEGPTPLSRHPPPLHGRQMERQCMHVCRTRVRDHLTRCSLLPRRHSKHRLLRLQHRSSALWDPSRVSTGHVRPPAVGTWKQLGC